MRHIGLCAVCLAAFVPPGAAQALRLATPGATAISAERPLADAAFLLEQLYGKVITYEEPLLVWSGDLEPRSNFDPSGKAGLQARYLGFVMPAETGIEPNLSLVLGKSLQAYHQATTGTRFRVLTSGLGYHIVPVQAHDEKGAMVPVTSALDARVTVATEERSALEHLEALGSAVSGAVGVHVWVSDARDFNNDFRRTARGTKSMQFKWGTNGAVARDALIDLLKGSATSMHWHLNCVPSAQPANRYCVLNLNVIDVVVTNPQGERVRRPLAFDHCGDCPPPPPPAGPPPSNR